MKKVVVLICGLVVFACKPKVEFYKDGKPCYTHKGCVKDHTETKYTYHWGYNWFTGKYEWHWGWETVTECDQYRTDTIEIK